MRLIIIIFICIFSLVVGVCSGKEIEGIVRIKVELNAPKKSRTAKVWIPYPVSDRYQTIENVTTKGNFTSSAVYREPKSGALYLLIGWDGAFNQRLLEFEFKVLARERRNTGLIEKTENIPVEVKKYLKSDWWIPTEREVKEVAVSIGKGKSGILEKARSVYDWVVENTYRDSNARGCGLGIVEVTLAKRSGKCADLSSVYVALARNIGVPAREVFGLRLGEKPDQNITDGYHCWAEFYLPGKGWIPVDPSDVRKIMFTKKIKLKDAKLYREYYFGSVDESRIVLERGGRGITFLPAQKSAPLNYFMYPYGEIDGKSIDYFDPANFRYSVHFKKI
ncbi:MAG: transglutaminase domain-containing protein [Bacteroidetes bacterium]|nr:transglutaminase domain-containing protein [Bacteroidota bacterium]